MSVIVKDMRFPNYCSDCEFSKPWGNSGTYCSRHPERDAVHYGEEKPDWCPLSNIPIPHGRLIDADELQRKFERMANEEWNKNIAVSAASCFDDAAVIVEDAPTIIEAEE